MIRAPSPSRSIAGTAGMDRAIPSGPIFLGSSTSPYLDREVGSNPPSSPLSCILFILLLVLNTVPFSNVPDDFAHTHINDIGLVPIPHGVDGKMGFNVVLGGYFSIKRATGAIPSGIWIPEEDAFDLCRRVLSPCWHRETSFMSLLHRIAGPFFAYSEIWVVEEIARRRVSCGSLRRWVWTSSKQSSPQKSRLSRVSRRTPSRLHKCTRTNGNWVTATSW